MSWWVSWWAQIFYSANELFMCSFRTYYSKTTESIWVLLWDCWWHGRLLRLLKDLADCDLPITNTEVFLQWNDMLQIQLNGICWIYIQRIAPFKCNASVGNCRKNNPNSAALKISFDVHQEIFIRRVFSHLTLKSTVHDLCFQKECKNATVSFFSSLTAINAWKEYSHGFVLALLFFFFF